MNQARLSDPESVDDLGPGVPHEPPLRIHGTIVPFPRSMV